MACLSKFTASQNLSCGFGLARLTRLARPVSAYVINASDIVSYSVENGLAYITRAPGTPASAGLECSNGATTVTVGVKGGEVAPQVADVTISTRIFNSSLVSSPTGLALTSGGANAQVVIAVSHGGIYRIYGLGAPLECLSIEGDSEGDGFFTVTYGVEDWQPGTTIYSITEADYAALSTAVGAGVTPPSGGS